VRDNAGFRLPGGEETIATRLKARGFRTAAFVSAFPLDSRFGLARGFDTYDDRFVDARARPAMLEQERSGSETVAAAKQWLREQEGEAPWFCWVHVYEPHFPYAPPEPYASRFPQSPYAGEVAATDAILAPLLEPVLDTGGAARTLVIVTSDHGESLGEHGEATHGVFAYESTLRVPLLLYYPQLLTPREVTTDVAHVDILPTILDMLGMPKAPELRGRSLLALSHGRSDVEVSTYFEALSGSLNRGWAPLRGIITGRLKYIDLPIPELYDLSADPSERRNLAPQQSQDTSRLHGLLAAFDGRVPRIAPESADVRERLRSLGYITAGTAPARTHYTEADDPKRLIGLEEKLQAAVGLYMAGNLTDALARSRALVAERPDMRVALLQLAHLEREAGNLPAAIDALRRALRASPTDAEAASLLGATLTAAGKPAEAVRVLETFAAVPDPDVQVLEALALAQARTARYDQALATMTRARTQDPSNARVLVVVGTVELMAGQRSRARAAFTEALSVNPDMARAHSSLGALAAEDGRRDEALSHWRSAVQLDPAEHEGLLATAVSLARAGREAEARPYMQLFVDSAPAARHGADIARARAWLSGRARH
jgi:arylsulfatase A-like enzyme/Flp pilus assembly protein TadD